MRKVIAIKWWNLSHVNQGQRKDAGFTTSIEYTTRIPRRINKTR